MPCTLAWCQPPSRCNLSTVVDSLLTTIAFASLFECLLAFSVNIHVAIAHLTHSFRSICGLNVAVAHKTTHPTQSLLSSAQCVCREQAYSASHLYNSCTGPCASKTTLWHSALLKAVHEAQATLQE